MFYIHWLEGRGLSDWLTVGLNAYMNEWLCLAGHSLNCLTYRPKVQVTDWRTDGLTDVLSVIGVVLAKILCASVNCACKQRVSWCRIFPDSMELRKFSQGDYFFTPALWVTSAVSSILWPIICKLSNVKRVLSLALSIDCIQLSSQHPKPFPTHLVPATTSTVNAISPPISFPQMKLHHIKLDFPNYHHQCLGSAGSLIVLETSNSSHCFSWWPTSCLGPITEVYSFCWQKTYPSSNFLIFLFLLKVLSILKKSTYFCFRVQWFSKVTVTIVTYNNSYKKPTDLLVYRQYINHMNIHATNTDLWNECELENSLEIHHICTFTYCGCWKISDEI